MAAKDKAIQMAAKATKSILSGIAMHLIPILLPIILIIILIAAVFIGFTGIEAEAEEREGTSFSSIGDYGGSTQEKLWWAFDELGLSAIAKAGIMGNIQVESGFDASVNQNHAGDTAYNNDFARKVDSGEISKESFMYDGVGYGLCQWTYYSRKEELYNYAKSMDASIADENMQISFLVGQLKELQSADQFVRLKNASSVSEATDAFEKLYENAGIKNMDNRIAAAEGCYETYKNATKPSVSDTKVSTKGGTETKSDKPGIRGYYTSSAGRYYTMYCQNDLSSNWYWTAGCFDCTIATIMSGFGATTTPNQLTGYKTGNGNREDFKTYGNCSIETYNSGNIKASEIKSFIQQGDAIMFHAYGLTTDNGSYGWEDGHWMSILDYKKENGKEKVYVCDPWEGEVCHGWGDLNTVTQCIVEYIHVWK